MDVPSATAIKQASATAFATGASGAIAQSIADGEQLDVKKVVTDGAFSAGMAMLGMRGALKNLRTNEVLSKADITKPEGILVSMAENSRKSGTEARKVSAAAFEISGLSAIGSSTAVIAETVKFKAEEQLEKRNN